MTEIKHSQLPWEVIEHPNGDDLFIRAPKNNPEDPYDIEVMGDDTNEDLYPLEQKRADAYLIVEATNSYPALVATNEKLLKHIAELEKQ